jgi:hypothetical protein
MIHEDVILLEQDATDLDKELEANLQLPERSRRPVNYIKQDFFSRVLDQQQERLENQKDVISRRKPVLARISILDLSNIGACGKGSFPLEPYILIRQEYRKAIGDLERGYLGGGKEACFSLGSPGSVSRLGDFSYTR